MNLPSDMNTRLPIACSYTISIALSLACLLGPGGTLGIFGDQEMPRARAKLLNVRVLATGGAPVPNVTVVSVGPETNAFLRGTSVEGGGQRLHTDSQGRLTLEWTGTNLALLVADDRGFCLAQSRDLVNDPVMMVKPWGRIEGVRINRKHRLTGHRLFLYSKALEVDDDIRERIDFTREQSITDSQGRFVFEKVPPVEIVIHDYAGATSNGELRFCGLQRLIVRAGETTRVELRTEKRTVIGRLAVPEGLTKGAFGFSPDVAWEKLNRPAVPKEFDTAERRAEWLRAWWKTDTGRQLVAAALRYRWPEVQSDGSFVAEMVEPGRYWLNGSIHQNGKTVAMLNEHLEIAAAKAEVGDSPFDVGTLAYKRVVDLKTGDAAPDFSARTLDGTPIKLSAFRGKYVLLDFWATWCVPCVAELPKLKATYDAFGKDERFVMMSLSLDSDPETPTKFVRMRGIAWPQVFLGKWSEDKVTEEYGVKGIPQILLIGPDGKIVGHGLQGNQIKEMVASALRPP